MNGDEPPVGIFFGDLELRVRRRIRVAYDYSRSRPFFTLSALCALASVVMIAAGVTYAWRSHTGPFRDWVWILANAAFGLPQVVGLVVCMLLFHLESDSPRSALGRFAVAAILTAITVVAAVINLAGAVSVATWPSSGSGGSVVGLKSAEVLRLLSVALIAVAAAWLATGPDTRGERVRDQQ